MLSGAAPVCVALMALQLHESNRCHYAVFCSRVWFFSCEIQIFCWTVGKVVTVCVFAAHSIQCRSFRVMMFDPEIRSWHVPLPVAARSKTLSLLPIACWDSGFESCRWHGCLFWMCVVSATGRSLGLCVCVCVCVRACVSVCVSEWDQVQQ